MRLFKLDEAIKATWKDTGYTDPLNVMTEIRDRLKALPTVDAVPVVHGRWEEVPYKTIEHGEVVIRGKTVRCSACRHAEKGWSKGMNFCPFLKRNRSTI